MLEVGFAAQRRAAPAKQDALRKRVRNQLGLATPPRRALRAHVEGVPGERRVAKLLYLDAERVTEALPGAVVLVRGHYNATREAEVFAEHPRIDDVTRYPDIAPPLPRRGRAGHRLLLGDVRLRHHRQADPAAASLTSSSTGTWSAGSTSTSRPMAPGPLLRSTDEVVAGPGVARSHTPVTAAGSAVGSAPTRTGRPPRAWWTIYWTAGDRAAQSAPMAE